MVVPKAIFFLNNQPQNNVDILEPQISFSTNEKWIVFGGNFPILTQLSTPLLSLRRPLKNKNEQNRTAN